MANPVCLTVDVEDWYDGMAVLGCSLSRPKAQESGLGEIGAMLKDRSAAVTFFVVGNRAAASRKDLVAFVNSGHEIASHGPDHGRLPNDAQKLRSWLRSGREMVEDVVQRPVLGFRAPRFDIPDGMDLSDFRSAIADAGFHYASDLHLLGVGSLAELPVMRWHATKVGGGSYQRLLPCRSLGPLVRRHKGPAVLYYHSYDFGSELPRAWEIRSATVAAQVLGRRRIPRLFESLLTAFGSVTCADALAKG